MKTSYKLAIGLLALVLLIIGYRWYTGKSIMPAVGSSVTDNSNKYIFLKDTTLPPPIETSDKMGRQVKKGTIVEGIVFDKGHPEVDIATTIHIKYNGLTFALPLAGTYRGEQILGSYNAENATKQSEDKKAQAQTIFAEYQKQYSLRVPQSVAATQAHNAYLQSLLFQMKQLGFYPNDIRNPQSINRIS